MNLHTAVRNLKPEQLAQLSHELRGTASEQQAKGSILRHLSAQTGAEVSAADLRRSPDLRQIVDQALTRFGGGDYGAPKALVGDVSEGGVEAGKVLGQFQFTSTKPLFVSIKAGLASVKRKDHDVKAAEKLFRKGHELQERHYPGLWSGNGPVGGEVEDWRVARAYLDRTDIDWDRKLQLDKKGRPIGEIDLNQMTSLNEVQMGDDPKNIEHIKIAAIEHGSSEASGPRANAFFNAVGDEAKDNGAQIIIAEMNLPGVMTAEELYHDLHDRPYARIDRIDYTCGDPNGKPKPGLGFEMVTGANGERALYGQLAFAGEEPVMHLALGIKVLDKKLLNRDGTLPTQIYLEAIRTYFASFENVNDEAMAVAKARGIDLEKDVDAKAKFRKILGEVVEANPTFKKILESVKGSESLRLVGAEQVSKTSAATAA